MFDIEGLVRSKTLTIISCNLYDKLSIGLYRHGKIHSALRILIDFTRGDI